MQLDPTIRHFFRIFLEVNQANPNGDPGNDNMPRQLPNNHGFITSYSLKSVARSYWDRRGKPLYISRDGDLTLEDVHTQAAATLSVEETGTRDHRRAMDKQLTKGFIDGRMFGGVFSAVASNKGNPLTGPVQVANAISLRPFDVEEITITRGTQTKKEKASEDNTMGRTSMVPHAIYMFDVSYDAILGQRLGVTEDDLQSFLDAMRYGFAERATTSKQGIETRLIVHLEQDDPLGGLNYMDFLNDHVKVEVTSSKPDSLQDYQFTVRTVDDTEKGRRLTIDEESLSKNIKLQRIS